MTAAKTAPEPAQPSHPHVLMDVTLYLSEIAGHQVTLVLTADSIAMDTQAQRDQEKLLLDYLQANYKPMP